MGPKRPSTAFFIFANEVRDEIREENPDASIGEIGKILGQQWNSLDEDRKDAYKAQNEKVLAAYKKTRKYAAYQQEVDAWKQAKKEAMRAMKAAGKKDNKKKVVKRKK